MRKATSHLTEKFYYEKTGFGYLLKVKIVAAY